MLPLKWPFFLWRQSVAISKTRGSYSTWGYQVLKNVDVNKRVQKVNRKLSWDAVFSVLYSACLCIHLPFYPHLHVPWKLPTSRPVIILLAYNSNSLMCSLQNTANKLMFPLIRLIFSPSFTSARLSSHHSPKHTTGSYSLFDYRNTNKKKKILSHCLSAVVYKQ